MVIACLAIAAAPLFGIFPPIKPTKVIWIFPTAFVTTLLTGQYFSSRYFWAIALQMAMVLSMVAAIAKLQLFG